MAAGETLDLWLDGHLAGKLHRAGDGHVKFIYDTTYASMPSPTPVSLSMPVGQLEHDHLITEAWLENLMPESSGTREDLARHFGQTGTDAFSILKHTGIDAPGSVQIVREGLEPSQQGSFEEVSEAEIAARLRKIASGHGNWAAAETGHIRFSLAGQQSKFALARLQDKWVEPAGRSASTHIFKPGMQSFTTPKNDDQASEFLTMRAAQKLGLRVADVDIMFFEEQPAFVVKRFDRVEVAGNVLRIHQEDLCQALGIFPQNKYEVDGGPGVTDTASLLSTFSSDPEEDKALFARALLFNLFTAGIDGHGKNFSLLLQGGNVRFAPLYDLISAHPLVDQGRLLNKGKMGMRYGKDDRIRGITARNLMRLADAVGIDRADLISMAQSMAEALPNALAVAQEELPDIPITDKVRTLPQLTAAFANEKISELDVRLISTVPPWQGK